MVIIRISVINNTTLHGRRNTLSGQTKLGEYSMLKIFCQEKYCHLVEIWSLFSDVTKFMRRVKCLEKFFQCIGNQFIKNDAKNSWLEILVRNSKKFCFIEKYAYQEITCGIWLTVYHLKNIYVLFLWFCHRDQFQSN